MYGYALTVWGNVHQDPFLSLKNSLEKILDEFLMLCPYIGGLAAAASQQQG